MAQTCNEIVAKVRSLSWEELEVIFSAVVQEKQLREMVRAGMRPAAKVTGNFFHDVKTYRELHGCTMGEAFASVKVANRKLGIS